MSETFVDSEEPIEVERACPFCGPSHATLHTRRFDYGEGVESTRKYWISCRSCAATGPWEKSETSALASWNGRYLKYANRPFLTFTVPGKPQPWQRTLGKRRVKAPETRAYQRLVADCAYREMSIKQRRKPFDGLCQLTLRIYVPDNCVRDGDNILKTAKDALNKVAYVDDRQVKSHRVDMWLEKDKPRVEVELRELGREYEIKAG